MNHFLKKLIPLIIIVIISILLLIYGVNNYLNYSSFIKYHNSLLVFVQTNFISSMLIFLLTYIIITATSIPGASIMSILGGFLFGNYLGTALAVIAATIGATGIFLAVRYAFADYVYKKLGSKATDIQQKIETNGFYYLLSLRIAPIVPFFLINLLSGIFKIKFRDFFLSTLIGIIPGAFVYVNVGTQLSKTLQLETFKLTNIFSTPLIIAFCLLGLFTLVPTLIKKVTKK